MSANPSSIDPANEDTLTGTFRHIFNKMMQDTNGMLPARVVAYNGNRNKPRVTVQPLIAILTTGGSQVSRAQIASLPVLQFGAGGSFISFPITVGDLGWIKANDRDISIFLQSFNESRPQTLRKNNFADALFIPDTMRGYTIAAEDNTNSVWQNLAGTVKLALWSTYFKLTAPRGLGINVDPHGSSIFNMASTTKSSSPWPKMTLAQRNAIPGPQEGDAVWIIGTGLSTFNGVTWS
jgi:hypothetical protein